MSLKLISVIVLIVTMKSIFSPTQKPKDPSVDLMMRLQMLIGQSQKLYFHFYISANCIILYTLKINVHIQTHSETEKVKITIITTMNY